jgi:SAM-dependent methyltransferase
MDIVPAGIRWCQEKITPRYPRFEFTLTDVYNKEYNPGGSVLASVFTHMLPEDMDHYIAEIARVLVPGGRCYASFSLVNPGSEKPMVEGRASLRLQPYAGPCWVVDPKVPELAVGYAETYVLGLYERYGFSPNEIRYGSWSGRFPTGAQPPFSQDVLVATKARQ